MNREKANMIYEAVYSVNTLYQDYAREKQIGYLDFLMFYVLLEDESKAWTQKDLTEKLNVTKTTVNTIIGRWKEKGMVKLSFREGSRKEKRIILTEAGKAYAQKIISPVFQVENTAAAVITDQDLDTVTNVIGKFKKALSAGLLDSKIE